MTYETVLWDFDGVWSQDFFYQSYKNSNPSVWGFIQTKIWGPEGDDRVNKWMRSDLNMDDINRLISQGTGLDFDLLTKNFLTDIAQMKIDMGHLPIVRELKKRDVKVGLVTNNMDVFSTVTVPRLNLLEVFDGMVFNSFNYHLLKAEGLFDIAMQKIGADYATTLLIDDSPRARAAFELKGGHTYTYDNFPDFKIWADQNLLI